jgi:hypothetical protein
VILGVSVDDKLGQPVFGNRQYSVRDGRWGSPVVSAVIQHVCAVESQYNDIEKVIETYAS